MNKLSLMGEPENKQGKIELFFQHLLASIGRCFTGKRSDETGNFLVLGETGAGKTYLAEKGYKNFSGHQKFFIKSKINDTQIEYYLNDKLLEKADNLATLFEKSKFIVIDELEGLLCQLSENNREQFILYLKESLKNKHQKIVIVNQRPISLLELNNFDCILVGKMNHAQIHDSYLKDFPNIEISLDFIKNRQFYFIQYTRKQNNQFKFQEVYREDLPRIKRIKTKNFKLKNNY